MKPALLYALHSSQLYGTERMTLATAAALAGDFEPIIFAPPGAALDEAARMGLRSVPFTGAADLARRSREFFAARRDVVCLTTGISQAFIWCAWAAAHRAPARHLHVVHGGAEERLSFGRKRLLAPFPVQFIAVSDYVKERLQAHGLAPERVAVIENFLSTSYVTAAPHRDPFGAEGVRRAVIVSRVDPLKRVDLILDALDRTPALREMSFRVLGTGWDLDSLRARAAVHPNVTFAGFTADVPRELAEADLLVHLCPTEPFGLAVLEGFAAQVPVLVPDTGGAASLVLPGRSGYRFRANDPDALAASLLSIAGKSASELNAVTAAARHALNTRFSAARGAESYRRLLTTREARPRLAA